MAVPGRGNGLQAETYAPLVDLDPQLADTMLELLRDSGIAAYAAPADSEPSGHVDRQRLPKHPAERLYVDACAVDPARTVLRTHLPGADPERSAEPTGRWGDSGVSPDPSGPSVTHRDEDEVWQEIVASYDREPTDDVPPWPPSEDLDEDDPPGAGRADGSVAGQEAERRGRRGWQGRAVRGSHQHRDEDHYVPPPPPPLPHPDPTTGLAWLCLFGGPTYLLIATMAGWAIPGWAAFLAVAAFIGGFVTLVVRMGDDEPPQDSGPDDGAVV